MLVNLLLLDKADEEAFLRVWQDDANFMKRQPGFISTQLHRAIGDSPAYLNYAVWESNAHFRAAFMHPEFRAKLSDYRPRRSRRRTCSAQRCRISMRLRHGCCTVSGLASCC